MTAALDEPWSAGPVEGTVERLEVIKRQMHGKDGFDLLRWRRLSARASVRSPTE